MQESELLAIAGSRRSTPLGLSRTLRGDLDWIILKALEKERSRRYETVAALAADIRHHLSFEPVSARPPGAWYSLQKLVRKHRLAFGAATLVLVSLFMALGASSWMYLQELQARHQAEAQRQLAQIEAAKSRQIAQFLQRMLQGVGPAVALGRDTSLLRDILDKTADEVGTGFTNQPEVEAELRLTLGAVYWALSEHDKAEPMIRRALSLRRKIFGEGHPLVGATLDRLALVLMLQEDKLAEAQAVAREALAMRVRQFPGDHLEKAQALATLANVLRLSGKVVEAEPCAQEALSMKRRLLGDKHPDLVPIRHNLAAILKSRGELPKAEAELGESLRLMNQLYPKGHPEIGWALHGLGVLATTQGRLSEAENRFRQALSVREKLFALNHPDVQSSLDKLVSVLLEEGKIDQAEDLQLNALAARRASFGTNNWLIGASLVNLGRIRAAQDRLVEAHELLLVGLSLLEKDRGELGVGVPEALQHLARVLLRQNALVEAESIARRAVAVGRRLQPQGHPHLVGAIKVLATVLEQQGELAAAEAQVNEALAMQIHLAGEDHPEVRNLRAWKVKLRSRIPVPAPLPDLAR